MRWMDTAASWVDEAVVGTRRLRGASDGRIDAMAARERMQRLTTLRPIYERDELLSWPDGFLRPGPPIAPVCVPVYSPQGRAEDLSWQSRYETWNPDIRERYAAASPTAAGAPNDTARARRYLAGERPGPAVIAIHGYGAGHKRLEPLIWPILRLRRAGIDTVLPVLPFHGQRAAVSGPPVFPAPDPRFSQEGFRQAVQELTSLIAWLRSEGHGPIGLAGMSLGGYTAALLATLLPDIAYAVLVIPLSSLADIALTQGRLGTGVDAESLHTALEAVYRPTMPFSRSPAIGSDRVLVVAARGDRITGVQQAERLAGHFSAPLRTVAGGHIAQYGIPWGEIARFIAQRSASTGRAFAATV